MSNADYSASASDDFGMLAVLAATMILSFTVLSPLWAAYLVRRDLEDYWRERGFHHD
jgi:hypothetical protein